jgi:hypothetical protein
VRYALQYQINVPTLAMIVLLLFSDSSTGKFVSLAHKKSQ